MHGRCGFFIRLPYGNQIGSLLMVMKQWVNSQQISNQEMLLKQVRHQTVDHQVINDKL